MKKGEAIAIKLNSNSPFISVFDIIAETEKAIKVKNSLYKSKMGWLPKKALKLTDNGRLQTFTFKMWFRNLENGKAITKASYLLD